MTILNTARQKQKFGQPLSSRERKAIRQSEKHKRLRESMVNECVASLSAQGKQCAVFGGGYVITDSGQFFVTNGKGWREGRPGIKPGGYQFVGIFDNGKAKYKMIHRLVAEFFVENPQNLPEVNHIDGNKINNSACNLEWVTRKQNAQHASNHGLMLRGESMSGSKLTEQDVRAIRESTQSCLITGKRFGVCAQTVNNIRRGKTWRHVE